MKKLFKFASSWPQSSDLRKDKAYNVTLFNFVFSLLVGICSVVQIQLFGPESFLFFGSILFGSLLLSVFLFNGLLVYAQKRNNYTSWIRFHLERAWTMTWVRIVSNIPMILGAVIAQMENPRAAPIESLGLIIYLNAIVFIPWSIVGLFSLLKGLNRQSMVEAHGATAESADQEGLVFEDFVKFVIGILLLVVIVKRLVHRFSDVELMRSIWRGISQALDYIT